MVLTGRMFHEMVEPVAARAAAPRSFEEAARAQEVVEAVIVSVRTKQWLSIPER